MSVTGDLGTYMQQKASRSFAEKMAKRASSMKPRIVSADGTSRRREVAESVMRDGMTLSPLKKRAQAVSNWTGSSFMNTGSGNSMFHTQRPYLPEFDSPDRQWYPIDRLEANYYWRLFYKTDPVFGTAVDMYSGMMISDFDIQLSNESDKTIENQLKYMCEKVNFLDKFQHMVKEFLVTGEAIPHCFFDSTEGIWSYLAFHNPDFIEIQDSPILDMEPIINFLPDDALRDLLTANTPESLEIRKRLPAEFVSKVLARQKIRMSPLNCSYVPRKLHPYDERGTSLASRLWRIWMVEDAVYNSTIATFRRASNPIKVLKLGDPSTGWIPDPSTEQDLLRMLAQAEMDPQCFVPETEVVLADSTLKPIGELRVGDSLLDRYGQRCNVEILQEEYTDEIVELTIAGFNKPIRCTPTHKWKIWGTPRHYSPNWNKSTCKIKRMSEKTGFDPYQEITADKFRVGDYVMIPRTFNEINVSGISKGQARLLGYYAAEGNSRKVYERLDGSIRMGFELSFHIKEKDTLVKDVIEIVEDICGYKANLYEGDRNNIQVRCNKNASSNLAVWINQNIYGGSAKYKRISEEVMRWPLELKWEFIKGYFRGDGCIVQAKDKPNYLIIGSASYQMLNQVRHMLCQLGIYSNFYHKVQNEKAFATGNDFYSLYIHGKPAVLLADKVWGESWEIENDKKQSWVDDDFIYVKVTKVEHIKCNEPQKVINMTVSGDHSYCVNYYGTENSWIVYNYGINFEAWGNTERGVTLSREHDTIEKVKLLALGLSKAFMGGEITYASAKGGLQVFLRRLLSLRQFFENTWILPKFFAPIIAINDWTKSTPAEVNHRIRVKRTAQEAAEKGLLITPKIKWRNKLDPSVDEETLRAYMQLKNFNFDISNDTIGSIVSLNWEDETRKKAQEFKQRDEILTNTLGPNLKQKYEQQAGAGAKPPGGAGSGAKPPGGAKAPGDKPTQGPPGSAEGGGVSDEGIAGPAEGMNDMIE